MSATDSAPEVRYYLTETDDWGMALVQEWEGKNTWEAVADHATLYPEIIYFEVAKPEPPVRFIVEHVAGVSRVWQIRDTENNRKIIAALPGDEGERLIRKTAVALNAGWDEEQGASDA